MTYELVKWLHILSSTVLFGTGIGTAFHLFVTWRRGSAEAFATAARHTVLADWLFTLPSGIFQPLSGLWLADLLGYDLLEGWLVVTYALYVLALACWLPVVAIQIRVARLATAAVAAGQDIPASAHRLMRTWFALGWPAFAALTAVFWLMVSKPTLW